jgi:hypothetical protein
MVACITASKQTSVCPHVCDASALQRPPHSFINWNTLCHHSNSQENSHSAGKLFLIGTVQWWRVGKHNAPEFCLITFSFWLIAHPPAARFSSTHTDRDHTSRRLNHRSLSLSVGTFVDSSASNNIHPWPVLLPMCLLFWDIACRSFDY